MAHSSVLSCDNGYIHTAQRGMIAYDIVRMWNLTSSQPVIMVPVKRLLPFLDNIGWDDHDAIDLPLDSEEHWDRLLEADLSSPLMICSEPFDLMDGCHRVMRAWLEDVPELPAREVDDVLERCKLQRSVLW
jgi:hypothetical protein